MTKPDFKIRFGKKGVVAVYEVNMSEESVDMLDAAYEVLGLRDAMWIREVVARDVQIIIFPSNRLPIDSSEEEAVLPPFF